MSEDQEPVGLLAPISDKARRAAPQTPDSGLPPEGTPINQFEVRGYEVVQLMPDGSWRCLYRLRDTELARRQGMADVKWFNSRGHKGVYSLRALVSAALPTMPEDVGDGPLVLEADEAPAAVVESAEAGGGLTDVATDLGDTTPNQEDNA